MPPLEESDMYQTALYWTSVRRDKFNEPILSSPQETICRWVTKRTQSVGSNGNPIALDATLIVPVELKEGTLVWKGQLADWNASLKNEIMEVVTFSETPSLNARHTRYELGLRKFKQTLPA